jgi:hypothetical protein
MDKVTLENYWHDFELQARIEAAARRERAEAFKSLLKQAWQALRG